MSQATLDKLTQWALWFAENRDRGRDNAMEHKFLKDAMDELGGVIADLLADVRELEGAPRESMKSHLI